MKIRYIAIALAFCCLPRLTLAAEQRTQDFSSDPHWDAENNRIVDPNPITVRQAFGYSQETNYAGQEPGEIGGVVWRSADRPAYYAKAIEPATFDTPLSCSGSFSLLDSMAVSGYSTSSTIYIGWFDPEGLIWRPINFLGFRLEGSNEPDGAIIEVSYGASQWTAGGDFLIKDGKMPRIAPDRTHHTWTLDYDPAGNDGNGSITFTLDDGEPFIIGIRENLRKQGATFTHFGIFNAQMAGFDMQAYFDDLELNGERFDFSTDPKWEGMDNQVDFVDRVQYGTNDFGYSPTSNAGGAAGELGGRFWSCNPDEEHLKGYYGDDIGHLTLENKLTAHGKFATSRYSIDSTFALGWFDHQEKGWPLKNFVGIYMDSYSPVGRIVYPFYGTKEGSKRGAAPYLTFLPDGTVYEWSVTYDPAGAEGNGAIAITFGDQKTTYPLAPGDKAKGADLDRFGVFNLRGANSKHCVVYLDDLEYKIE